MDRLYTPEVRRYVFSHPWPSKFILDIEEPEGMYILFTLYRDNLNRFDGEDQLQIANTMRTVLEKLNTDGIPCSITIKKEVPVDG